MFLRRKFLSALSILLLFLCPTAYGKVDLMKYGITSYDTASAKIKADLARDSFYLAHPFFGNKYVIYNIEHTHNILDKTNNFYLLLFLCLLLGLIRYRDRRYFQNLWRAFINPTLSNRQLRDQLESTPLPNLLTNIFFAASVGAYIYYVGVITMPQRSVIVAPSILVISLVLGVTGIYIIKYGTIKFAGWVFRVEGVTDQYLFNVFLINKIIGIILLPFIILLAFANAKYSQSIISVSFILIFALLINRYVRSWQAFSTFFKYSKFHFFTYLCASELLPTAVLMKLLVQGLQTF